LPLSFHLYYFVWLVHCDLSARPWRSYGIVGDLTVTLPRRPHGIVGDLTALLRRPHGDPTTLLSERQATAFVLSMLKCAPSPGVLWNITAFSGVACISTAHRSAFWIVLERYGNAVLVWQLHN